MVLSTLTLVPLIIGIAVGVSIGGSAIGHVIYVVVSVAGSVVWLGVVPWGIAAIWRRRTAP